MSVGDRVQPFEFGREFDGSEVSFSGDLASAVREVANLEAKLAQLKDEIARQEQRARAEAYEAGRDDARKEQQVALLHAVDAINAALENVSDALVFERRKIVSEAAAVALAAAEHLSAGVMAAAPHASLETAIARVLDEVGSKTTVSILIAPQQVDDVEKLLRERHRRTALEVMVTGDATVAPNDARILWQDGSLVLDIEARRQAVSQAITAALG